MDNPFRPSNNGAAHHPWSRSPKNEQTSDKKGYQDPNVPPPDPSTYYYTMTGTYNQASGSQPDGSQPSQVPLSNPQSAVTGPPVPSYYGVASYRPTDPNSLPQYQSHGPFGPLRPADPKQQHNPRGPVTGAFAPSQPATTAHEQEPRFIRAAQTGPGQYMPAAAAQGQGVAGGPPRPIQAMPAENPFATAGRGPPRRSPPGGDTGSFDRRFLRSLVGPHEEDCSASEAGGLDEDLCSLNRSPSPSVLKRARADDALGRRVRELEGQIARMEGVHEREMDELRRERDRKIAEVKDRAAEVVGDAVHDICGIERGSVVWGVMVSEAREKMDDVSTV